LASGIVDPAWPVAGLDLCPIAQDQKFPEIVEDGAGGAVVAWSDERNNVDFRPDLYAQRVSSTGAIMLPPNRGPVIVTPGLQMSHQIAADGAGGAYVAWEDNRAGNLDLFAQHLDPVSGAQLWPAPGLPVCVQPGAQTAIALTSDAGQMLLAWHDSRGGSAP